MGPPGSNKNRDDSPHRPSSASLSQDPYKSWRRSPERQSTRPTRRTDWVPGDDRFLLPQNRDEESEMAPKGTLSVADSLLNSILDPSENFVTLRRIEKELSDLLSLSETSHSPFAAINKDNGNKRTLTEYLFDACALWEGYQRLSDAGYCTSYINILLQDPLRPGVAIATKIEDQIFKSLRTVAQEVYEGLISNGLESSDKAAFEEMISNGTEFSDLASNEALYAVLIPGGIEFSNKVNSLKLVIDEIFQLFRIPTGSIPPRFDEKLGQVRMMLSLSLISYAGSHVSAFDATICPTATDAFPINGNFALRRCRLACLSNFIGDKAWIFGDMTLDGNSELEMEGKGKETIYNQIIEEGKIIDIEFLVSISVGDFASLWGPVWAVPVEGDGDKIQSLHTDRGIIIPSPTFNVSSTRIHETETPCHWYKIQTFPSDAGPAFMFTDKDKIPPAGLTDFSMKITLSPDSQLLLGTPALRTNEDCLTDIKQVQKDPTTNLQFPGVYPKHYILDSINTNISAGKFIIAGISRAVKPVPASTLKSRIVLAASTVLQQKDNFELTTRFVSILDLLIGVKVSVCTGNATRFKLRDAIAMAEAKPIPPERVNHNLRMQTHSTGIDRTTHLKQPKPIIESRYYEKNRPEEYWPNAILQLACTGVDAAGNFQAFWPFSQIPQTLCVPLGVWKESHRWIHLLKDTDLTATFAVVSRDCLEFPSRRLPQHRSRCKNPGPSRLPLDVRGLDSMNSVLSTRIQVDFGSSSEHHEKGKQRKVLYTGDQIKIPTVGLLKIEAMDLNRNHTVEFRSTVVGVPEMVLSAMRRGKKVHSGKELINEETANTDDIVSVVVI